MKKTLLAISMALLLNIGIVLAHEHNFPETKQLIDSGISCDELTDEQLEAIGEYYMGQMHPGEAHELMDQMMGGENSESLKQMHVQMAKKLYCNKNIGGMMDSEGMMEMMMDQAYSNNDMMIKNTKGGVDMMDGYGMMGGSSIGMSLWWLVQVVITAFIFGIIFWWTKKLIMKK